MASEGREGGKATASSIAAEESRIEKSAHMHTDDFYHYLSKGAIPPYLPESNVQNTIVIETFLAAAKRYARGGYDVIVDGMIGPWFLKPWLYVVQEGYEVHYIVLRTTKEETLKRVIERSKLDMETNIELAETMWEVFRVSHSNKWADVHTCQPMVGRYAPVLCGKTVAKLRIIVDNKEVIYYLFSIFFCESQALQLKGGIPLSHQTVIVLDFGGQYNQLIARRVRECGVYCEVKPYTTPLADICAMEPIGIIFTGGPNSVYDPASPQADPAIFKLGVPILGICYGCQLLAHNLGGRVVAATEDSAREYGKTETYFSTDCKLFKGLPEQSVTWMSHGDYMEQVPTGFSLVAHSDACPNVAICDEKRGFYGVQYHPEVNHTQYGTAMIRNFLYEVCGAKGDWTMGDYKTTAIRQIQEKVGGGKVLLALSGGVDSSVAAALVAEAVGNQLTCVFVDHGLMRLNEGDEVEAAFRKWNINFVRANAEDLFLGKLAGVSDPETKRKIIGEEFIRVFEAEAKKIGQVDYLVQGTIYPDVIESGTGDAAVIKSHHNVGGLPDYVDFKEIIEPLRMLFKDEVRQLGRELGLPEYLVSRQPFPGPGLAIRIIGDITKEKADTLRLADAIFREEIAKAGEDRNLNQYFAVLTNSRSVGVMGDGRTYDYTLALRAVTTSDFMTADWARIPYELLDRISTRIVNEVPGINRICYDITSKPPATIEWE